MTETILGICILLLWSIDPSLLQFREPNVLGMNPVTAFSCILLGTALVLLSCPKPLKGSIQVLAIFIVGIALCKWGFGWGWLPFSIDQLFFGSVVGATRYSYPTSFCLALLGAFLFTRVSWPGVADRYGHWLLLPISLLVLFSSLGFLLGDPLAIHSFPFSPLALLTTTALGIGIAAAWITIARNPVIKTLSSPQLGGLLARRLLYYLIGVPVMMEVFRNGLEAHGWISHDFSNAAQMTILLVILLILIYSLARHLNVMDSRQQSSMHQLDQRSKELEKLNAELEQFTYAASHDLKEPLRKIATYSSLLFNTTLSDSQKIYIEKISGAANRGLQLIQDLLAYSRLTQSGVSVFMTTNLNQVVQQVLVDLERPISDTLAEVSVQPLPIIEAIEFQMHQLFSNLLVNAIKFRREGIRPQVSVVSQAVEGGYSISITDNGIGLKQELAPKIFEVFQRLAPKSVEGSGIGLSICKKIVDIHRGNIFVTSAQGHGAIFTVFLPSDPQLLSGSGV